MTSPPPTIDPTRHCPKCDYVLAGLPGTPERWDGTFVADVACPECGGTVPAGARVLEGAIHPGGLKPVPGVFLAMLVVNILAIGFMGSFAVREMLRGGGPSGHSWLGPTIQFLSNGGIVVWLAWLAWRRSPMARRKARAAPAGREVRWIVGPGASSRSIGATRSSLRSAPGSRRRGSGGSPESRSSCPRSGAPRRS